MKISLLYLSIAVIIYGTIQDQTLTILGGLAIAIIYLQITEPKL